MELSVLGLLVQTIGAGLLACVLLYLSRGERSRALRAAGWAWLFLFVSLGSLLAVTNRDVPFSNLPYQYFKLLYLVALIVAAARMVKETTSLVKPLVIAAVVVLPVSFGIVLYTGSGSLFYAVHMGILAVGWIIVAVLVYRGWLQGLGRRLCGMLALLTIIVQMGYVAFFALSAADGDVDFPLLAYTGFYDLFLEMLFGMGLIVWAMEENETRLSMIHARARDDTQRSKRRVQMDPLSESYNRFFLDELRPSLAHAGGSIVLIDVDGLKTINDQEGHEEGDKAIWTVATAIKKLIRGDDYLIRWGGDEFLVILPGMEEELAKRRFYMLPAKIEEVRQSPIKGERAYKKFLAASVGVTPFSARVPFDIAIEQADRVMYERKKAHKEMRGTESRRGTGSVRRVTGDKT